MCIIASIGHTFVLCTWDKRMSCGDKIIEGFGAHIGGWVHISTGGLYRCVLVNEGT